MATSNRVLVVETERDLAVRLVATLEGHGFDHVDVVRSADGVLDAIVRSEPVVVLMEVSVSGEHDGLALAEEIIQQHGIPVVFLTGESDPQVVGRMHEVGAASVLVKPFSESEVPRVLRAAIARSRRVRQLAERNNRLWVTLQSIADAVVTVDVEGRVEHLNPAAERLSGWSVSAARGRRIEAVLDLRRTEGEPLVLIGDGDVAVECCAVQRGIPVLRERERGHAREREGCHTRFRSSALEPRSHPVALAAASRARAKGGKGARAPTRAPERRGERSAEHAPTRRAGGPGIAKNEFR